MSQNPNSGTGNAAQGSQGQQSHQGTAQGQQPQNAQQGQQAPQGNGQGAPQNQTQQGRTRNKGPNSTTEEVGSWFTETLVRAGILVLGVAVMIFAIGQAVGASLLEPLAEFFASGTGAWFIVAFLALLVMVAATKSWRTVN
ncbi:hypothetical protein [Halomarina rubra]|uniref:Uncharacterized protein n=1 Tax=Halomarina rubra TaxID=2071873 RepID=A0ABD6B1I2_9EURY|nr:hypothetical protein [Halomarina rubra]